MRAWVTPLRERPSGLLFSRREQGAGICISQLGVLLCRRSGTRWYGPSAPRHRRPQGFQDGEVGFPGAIVVNALAMADPDMLRRGQRRGKAGNQGGFANAGFTGDKPYLSFLPGVPL